MMQNFLQTANTKGFEKFCVRREMAAGPDGRASGTLKVQLKLWSTKQSDVNPSLKLFKVEMFLYN